jgi:hypothetical protein
MNPILRRVKSALRSRKERRERAPAEVVIVSFPKSGRTWLRLMIGKALCELYALPDERMLDTPTLTRAAGLPPSVFTHDGASNMEARHVDRLTRDKSDYRDKKVLLLARDPRDVVTSCYFQASRRRDLFKGSISEFVRDPRYGIRKILTWLNIWEENRSAPKEFRVLHYEELRLDPHRGLRSALEFMGVSDLDEHIVSSAVEFARFENMKRMEEERRFKSGRMHPGQQGDRESHKVRRGQVGGYVDYLSPEDVDYCDRAIAELGCPWLSLEKA